MASRSFCIPIVATALLLTTPVRAAEDSPVPDWSGAWVRIGPANTFAGDRETEAKAPLTSEYRAKFEADLASRLAGKPDTNPTTHCLPPGMPRAMVATEPMEIVITPKTVYILNTYFSIVRRLHIDANDWPANSPPSFVGTSLAQWEDSAGRGRYDTLAVETRNLRGPRTFDLTGLPLHEDNQTVIKERIHLDEQNPDLLHDDITTFDHALTSPWTVTRSYRRDRNPSYTEFNCGEDNHWVVIGDESYYLGGDGALMPTAKDQKPPDLRHFQE